MPCPLYSQLAWQRGRHHIRVRPHILLQAATAAIPASSATFSFFPAASQLAFLWGYQLYGTAVLPLGALLEMGAAAAAACMGDGGAQKVPQLVMANAAVPTLAQLAAVAEAAGALAVVCSLSLHSGQLEVASGPSLQLRLTARLESSPKTAALATGVHPKRTHLKVGRLHPTLPPVVVVPGKVLTERFKLFRPAGSAHARRAPA